MKKVQVIDTASGEVVFEQEAPGGCAVQYVRENGYISRAGSIDRIDRIVLEDETLDPNMLDYDPEEDVI